MIAPMKDFFNTIPFQILGLQFDNTLQTLQILLNALNEFVKCRLLVPPSSVCSLKNGHASGLFLVLCSVLGFVLCFIACSLLSPGRLLKSHGTVEIILHLRLIPWIYLSGRIPLQYMKDGAF